MGFAVVNTRWNLNRPRKYERRFVHRTLTPQELSSLESTGFSEQTTKTIIPSLKGGSVILCDRYYFTALVRDQVCDQSQYV
jgi:thymidylate kinase